MKYTIFETFVGAGGSHLGFKNAGFKSVFVNDIDKTFMETLLYNNPEIKKTALISVADMTTLNAKNILKDLSIKKGDLDVMFGGIVCKGFSLAGERSPSDPRNTFYRYQLNLVKEIKPKISIIENVPAIINALILREDAPANIKQEVDKTWQQLENFKGEKAQARKTDSIDDLLETEGKTLRNKKKQLEEMLKEKKYLVSVYEDIEYIYTKMGYKVYKKILNAADFGSFTKRERVIIVAIRKDIPIEYEFPKPTVQKHKTVKEALDLIDYSIKDNDNVPMNHNKKTVERFSYVPEGKNIVDVMEAIPRELRISKFYSRGATMRLDSKKPSPTLVPGHSNFPIHPYENRSITVREAATITGFPLNYKFFGSHTKRCEQVGNAVPIHLSTAIAKSCKKLLDQYYKNKD